MSSVIPVKCSSLPSDWMLYEEMTRMGMGAACVRCCTIISPITVALFTGPAKLSSDAVKENSAEGPGMDFSIIYVMLLYKHCLGLAQPLLIQTQTEIIQT